jgi:hypothetical protein
MNYICINRIWAIKLGHPDVFIGQGIVALGAASQEKIVKKAMFHT